MSTIKTSSPKSEKLKQNGLSILIIDVNRERIQFALDQAQGESLTNILTADDIFSFAQSGHSELEQAGIPRSYRPGAMMMVWSTWQLSQTHFCKTDGTVVRLEFRKMGWTLVHANRFGISSKRNSRNYLSLTRQQKHLVVVNTMNRYGISRDEAIDSASQFLNRRFDQKI